jgi:iron complex outermembrane receptor protein
MSIKTFKYMFPLVQLAMLDASIASEVSSIEEMEVIVVSSSRSNISSQESAQVVTLITRKQIEEQLAISSDSSQILSSLLPAYAPGSQKLSGRGESFRGRTPLIMIDGVPQSNPLRPTGRSAHTIDLAMVERIEVIHGANAIHGLGATGGIINYITRQGEKGSFNQHLQAQFTTPTSSIDSENVSHKLNYSVDGNQGSLDYLVAVSYEEQGLFLDDNNDAIGVDNTQGDLMNSEAYDIFMKLGYWIDDEQKLGFQVNRYVFEGKNEYVSIDGDRENGIPTTSKKETPIGMAPSNKVTTVNASYTHNDFYGTTLAFQAYSQKFKGLFGATDSGTFQDIAIAPLGTLFDQSEAKSSKIGTKLTLVKDDLFNDKLKLSGGFDLLKDTTEQSLALTDRSWVPESDFLNKALFIQAQVDINDNLILHSGIRYETVKLDVDSFQTVASQDSVMVNGGDPSFNESLLNFGVVYHPIESVRLFANYSEGFEMADIGRALRGIDNRDNVHDVDQFLDLKPIITDNVEVGIRFGNTLVDLEFSYYESSSDFGSRLELIDEEFALKRQKTETSGLEALAEFTLNEQQKLKLAYSYIEGEFDSDNNGSVDSKLDGRNISPNRLVVSWTAHWSEKINTLLQINHAFDRSFDDPELKFSGYTLVDASIGYKLPYGKVNLSASNLLNEGYFTYFSQSGEAKDERYFKGRGRTLTLGYALNF